MFKRDDITKEVLERYLNTDMSQMDIAVALQAAQSTIGKYIKKYGLTRENRRNKEQSNYDEERMKKYLAQGRTKEEIAQLFGISESTVNRWVTRHHLKRPAQKQPKPKKPQPVEDKRKKCSTCIYKEASKTAGNCDYLRKVGHSRGCPVIGCTVYKPAGRKK